MYVGESYGPICKNFSPSKAQEGKVHHNFHRNDISLNLPKLN